jgi:hypothetical protein
MKRYIYLIMAGVSSLVFASCEGPMGPPGTNGSDGTPGVDGNATCLVCHNLDTKATITAQYDESAHGSGSTTIRATSNQCARCHSDQGFKETRITGRDSTATGFPIPQKITCETCHDFHQTLNFAVDGPDYALRVVDPVKFSKYPSSVVDFGNSANLCASCHQPLTAAPGADPTDVNWDQLASTYKVTSTHYGPHHGPEGTILAGIGGYKPGVDGSNSTHKTAGCATCHMHRSGTNGKANHTWEPSVDACKTCHAGATSFDVDGKQTEIDGLIAQLKTLLTTSGLLAANGNPVLGTYPIDDAGALYNYLIIVEDKSHGVHNYAYIKAILQEGISLMSK